MASIIAKVARDRMMADLDAKYPGYGFAKHKGYGTEEHRDAVDPPRPQPHPPGDVPAQADRAPRRTRPDGFPSRPLTRGAPRGHNAAGMPGKKHTSLDRVLGRLDTLDAVNLANLVQRLAKERALFEQIFNTLQEGVLVIDADGVIEYANEAAAPAARALRRRPRGPDPLAPGARACGPRSTRGRRARGAHVAGPRVRAHLSGAAHHAALHGALPAREERRARRHAVILADVTRDKLTTEQRIEDERTSSILLLAAGVAHELGNPLNSLTIHLQLIARKLKKLKASAEVESRRRVGRRLPRGGRAPRRDHHPFPGGHPAQPPGPRRDATCSEVLAEVLKFQKREFADRGIAVEAETPADLPPVMADRDQLKQVFFNITKNAMEAMQPGGRLKIKSRADDDSVYLLFGDSGSGIRQEDLLKLFQPYHTTKRGRPRPRPHDRAADHARPRRPGRRREPGGHGDGRHPPVPAQGPAGADARQRDVRLGRRFGLPSASEQVLHLDRPWSPSRRRSFSVTVTGISAELTPELRHHRRRLRRVAGRDRSVSGSTTKFPRSDSKSMMPIVTALGARVDQDQVEGDRRQGRAGTSAGSSCTRRRPPWPPRRRPGSPPSSP